MARRKTLLDDGSSDSGASGSDQDFPQDDAYNSQDDEFKPRSKRRRLDGKKSAWEGVFGEEEDDDYGKGYSGKDRNGGKKGKAKAPTFVAPTKAPTQEPVVEDVSNAQHESAQPNQDLDQDMGIEEESDASTSSHRSRQRSPLIKENDYSDEDIDDQPRVSGIGAKPSSSKGAGIGSTGGIGFRPAGGGIGAKASTKTIPLTRPSFAPASSSTSLFAPPPAESSSSSKPPMKRNKPSLMFGGIGSAKRHNLEEQEEEALYPKDEEHGMPLGFGKRMESGSGTSTPISNRKQRAFIAPESASTSSPSSKPVITTKDLRYLSSISDSLGARMLAKQGWSAGKGLGKSEDGKAVPIEANIGLARGQGIGKGVRTEQSKREARAKGEKFSEDEEEDRRKESRRKGKNKENEKQEGQQPQGKGENAEWKKSRKVKVKVEHKSYEQLLAEAGDVNGGIGMIYDARSGQMKEVSSIAALSLSSSQNSWTPTSDKTRLPELRHNLRLILDSTKGDVTALAKEGKGVEEKRKWALGEEKKLRGLRKAEEDKTIRLQAVQEIVKALIAKVSEIGQSQLNPLLPLAEDFELLLGEYASEYEDYELDEVVVGAIAQVLHSAFRDWQPLNSDQSLARTLIEWKKAYRYSSPVTSDGAVGVYDLNGRISAIPDASSPIMTPFESLMNSSWLPKVRSAINNEWNPKEPQAALELVETWSPILPRFMMDNILDQLIIPKLQSEIRDWNPKPRKGRESYSMAAVVFPWLQVLGERAEGMLEEGRLRVGEGLKRWKVADSIAEELPLWRDIFSRGKWDTLILLHILPKLASHLDQDFEINPRDQNMSALDTALGWSGLMRDSIFSQLLEERFFPKWLDTLHFWLIQPNYKPGEVATWYDFWKDYIGKSLSGNKIKLTEVPAIAHGFRYGVQSMNDAMTYGVDAPSKLMKPVFKPYQDKKKLKDKAKKTATSGNRSGAVAHTGVSPAGEVTFRTIAEEHAAIHDLLFVPTGKSHSSTGKPLFKVSKTADGKGGVTVYVGEDAVYALKEDGTYRAVMLDEMVNMGKR